eukprot:scaffold123671_cov55-Prasinocladus_malaysianus.AAC.1
MFSWLKGLTLAKRLCGPAPHGPSRASVLWAPKDKPPQGIHDVSHLGSADAGCRSGTDGKV